jgi:DHA2 family multidrug resistance protein
MPDRDDAWRPAANPWLIALAVTLPAFMEVLDTTIVNVALPYIAGSMAVSNDQSTWTLTSYLVANGIVLFISGWLANRIGRKRYFIICIVMFTVFSFLCGISSNIFEIILFRLLQGFFGGGLQPNQQSIILDVFPPEQRGRAFGLTAIATIVAPVLGPTVGGWLTVNYSWPWIFFINVPIGIATAFLVGHLVEDPPWQKRAEAEAKTGTDYVGLGLITLGIGSLQVMMDRGEDLDWFGSTFITTLACLAAIGLVGATIWLLVAKEPVVNIRILADRNFGVGCLMISAMAAVLYASAVVIPQFAQTQLGYTAYLAGLILSPGAVVVVLLIPLVTRLMPIVQTRLLVALGFLGLGLSLLYSNHLVPDLDFYTLAVMRMAQTFGLAFLFVPISTVAYSTLPKEQNGDAAALFTMFRNVVGSLAISAATAVVTQRTQVRLANLQPFASPLHNGYDLTRHDYVAALHTLGHVGQAAQQSAQSMLYQAWQTQASILAYGDLFSYTALLSFAIVPLTLLFSAHAGGGSAPAG